MNEDLRELLESLRSHEVDFIIIGGHAVAFHGRPRYTENLGLWVGRAPHNARKLKQALEEFGAPIGEEGAERFSQMERQMIRLGTPRRWRTSSTSQTGLHSKRSGPRRYQEISWVLMCTFHLAAIWSK